MSSDELVELAKDNEIEIPYTGKGSKKKVNTEALRTTILEEFFPEDDGEDSEGGEDDEEDELYTKGDLEEMSVAELEELVEETDITIPKKKVRGKSVTDKAKLIDAILAFQNEDDEE